ncbi:hypothetical protein UFOVP621_57 [uncultured Caudovirales phage]|uniref:Uncharacterized protein n=1 Tax=uncultured Caudovirales phage TaxID=2100421 RepID=A0A6J5N4I1_9CAUD|nr:hypothetical protein UFOVP621_57 [uncultured Caudovirales phage]
MTKCNNCDFPAEYVFSPRGAKASYYCKNCVPWTLKEKLRSGQLDRVTDVSEPAVEKNTEAVAEPEAVAEEVDEAVAEEVAELPEAQEEEAKAPKPAPRKKKAVAQPDSES